MFETNQARRSTLSSGTVVSLLLHVCLAACLLWAARSPQVRHAVMRQLNIEVMGPRAKQQTIALQKRIVNPRPSEPAPQKEQQDPKSKPVVAETLQPDPAELKIKPSESHSDSPDALHLPLTATAPTTASHAASAGAASRNGNSGMEQNAQSISRPSNEADLINAYASALKKLVDGHLIYPKDVRKKKLEGMSWVSFVVTSSGAIAPGSLQIKKSSGYAVLDDNALKTIQSLAPFQKPPHEMTISLGIEFALDN